MVDHLTEYKLVSRILESLGHEQPKGSLVHGIEVDDLQQVRYYIHLPTLPLISYSERHRHRAQGNPGIGLKVP